MLRNPDAVAWLEQTFTDIEEQTLAKYSTLRYVRDFSRPMFEMKTDHIYDRKCWCEFLTEWLND